MLQMRRTSPELCLAESHIPPASARVLHWKVNVLRENHLPERTLTLRTTVPPLASSALPHQRPGMQKFSRAEICFRVHPNLTQGGRSLSVRPFMTMSPTSY